MSQNGLRKELLPRHVQFLALAGMIGTGIFKGSGETIGIAGPGVVVSYLLGGVLLLIVMVALAEMAVMYPNHNVQHLVHKAFGFHISFIVGWLYWINWTLVTIVEILAAGSFLQFWFSETPLWLLSAICAAIIISINSLQVKFYGEMEFWFASIKIIALVLFIILGGAVLLGLTDFAPDTPTQHLLGHGGFFPNGLQGVFSACLIVMFSFGGSELIGVAISETKDVKKVLPKVIKGVVWRVLIFYILPITIIAGLIPWDQVAGMESPFTQVMDAIGIPGVAHVMNFILLTAVLSAANSGMFATSRTMFALAEKKEAPQALTKTSKSGAPINAITLNGGLLLVGAGLAYFAPESIIGTMMTIPGFTMLLLWLSICAAQLKLRPGYAEMPYFKMKLFPTTTIVGIAGLGVILIGSTFSKGVSVGTVVCFTALAILIVLALVVGRYRKV
ncbi:amino acid/polyamine/organocation transporter, APC superfamily [Terribacillus aidingensis]|uniref:Amino acid/polyamine/organocation transporter, APC superfamily n=2 Tax=Terribacillus aidingensis TaxID=586416 RepID=A0A285NPP0_9BACI|nr:amino acid permease [Terribacillus aidingensis]SNZ11419.1 amino acid/polyamine/organocation transporter, APC superfamily [Terribacillus aidingensis]